jgi:hypothetical protein
LPAFRFDKASSVARRVKSLLGVRGGAVRGAVSKVEPGKKLVNERREPSRMRNEQQEPPPERIETAQLRQSPDFVIIGTQRGGTTSLYRYLSEHPHVGAALRKEVHFFDRHYERGMDWYSAHFPMRGEAPVVGEASPYYLFDPRVPERVRRAIPDAKFIALLRNPVDRAYSQYRMRVRRDAETLSFEEAIAKESERMSASDDPASVAWRHHSYVKRGLYAEQLERWMSVFPRERFLILKSEDFYENPERILHDTQKYLGLRPWSPGNFKAYHMSEYDDMEPDTRKRLGEYFAEHNKRLYALLGEDFGWEDE